jgi:hypothetical protein
MQGQCARRPTGRASRPRAGNMQQLARLLGRARAVAVDLALEWECGRARFHRGLPWPPQDRSVQARACDTKRSWGLEVCRNRNTNICVSFAGYRHCFVQPNSLIGGPNGSRLCIFERGAKENVEPSRIHKAFRGFLFVKSLTKKKRQEPSIYPVCIFLKVNVRFVVVLEKVRCWPLWKAIHNGHYAQCPIMCSNARR